VHWDAIVKNGVWLTAKYFNTVAKIDERFSEMTRIHTLAANVWLPAIREIGQTQWAIGVVRST
jgi:hypothetical protein